jgi:DNA-binding response OmpR family regulator
LERVLFGELHLVRRRLDAALTSLSAVARTDAAGEQWEDVEQAARIAYRGLTCAVAALPACPDESTRPSLIRVGPLTVDTYARRQSWEQEEFELSPLLHRLLACLASEPSRCFARDELLRLVWLPLSHSDTRASAIPAAIMRLRRALGGAGAPAGEWLVTRPRVGWALRPERVR